MFNFSFLYVKFSFRFVFVFVLFMFVVSDWKRRKMNFLLMPYGQKRKRRQHTSWTLLIISFFFFWGVFFASRFFSALFVVVVVFFCRAERKRTQISIYSISILDYGMSFAIGNKRKFVSSQLIILSVIL